MFGLLYEPRYWNDLHSVTRYRYHDKIQVLQTHGMQEDTAVLSLATVLTTSMAPGSFSCQLLPTSFFFFFLFCKKGLFHNSLAAICTFLLGIGTNGFKMAYVLHNYEGEYISVKGR